MWKCAGGVREWKRRRTAAMRRRDEVQFRPLILLLLSDEGVIGFAAKALELNPNFNVFFLSQKKKMALGKMKENKLITKNVGKNRRFGLLRPKLR